MDVLDRFDKILNEACKNDQSGDPTQCIFMCPRLQDEEVGRGGGEEERGEGEGGGDVFFSLEICRDKAPNSVFL